MQLTQKQQEVFDQIESSSDNFMILGKPGVGKSVLINALVEQGKKDYSIAAPTGLAAINVGGKTLHSLFRIPVIENGIIPDDLALPDRMQLGELYRVNHLIIDEVSMVRADVLDYIDRLLKNFKNNNQPFGGIQIILVGDFCQLPPVCRPDAIKELKDHDYESEFAFSAHCFDQQSFKVIELNEVLRQKDDLHFMNILSAARFGMVSMSMMRDLNELVGPERSLTITLTATNSESDQINDRRMSALSSPPILYQSKQEGEWPRPLLPLPEMITLKAGAQVMVRKNIVDSELVNGHLALATETLKDQAVLSTGQTVLRQTFTRSRKNRDQGGQWVNQVVGSFNQLPLVPAWAISMHKSQGQSFDFVNINPQKVFAPGQLYVALSRARTMKGLTLLHPVDLKKFKTNPIVKKFYENL